MTDSDVKTGFKIVLGRPTLPNSPSQKKGSTDEDIKVPKSKPQSCRKPTKKSKKELEKEKLRQENEVMQEAAA